MSLSRALNLEPHAACPSVRFPRRAIRPGQRGCDVDRFAGIGAIRPRTGTAGGARGRQAGDSPVYFPAGPQCSLASAGRAGVKLGLKLVTPPPMAGCHGGGNYAEPRRGPVRTNKADGPKERFTGIYLQPQRQRGRGGRFRPLARSGVGRGRSSTYTACHVDDRHSQQEAHLSANSAPAIRLNPATSASGLGSPRPHLPHEWLRARNSGV